MTGNDLLNWLLTMKQYSTTGNDYLKAEIVIELQEPGFPAKPCVSVKNTSLGIDWDTGKMFIHPSESLIRKPCKKKK